MKLSYLPIMNPRPVTTVFL